MNLLLKILVASLALVLLSCNQNDSVIIPVPEQECSWDTATMYCLMTYHPDPPSIRRIMQFKKRKLEGFWTEYYQDGIQKRNLYFEDDKWIPELNRSKLPKVIFENDSLIRGVQTRIRVPNLYPGEALGCGKNIKVESLPGDPLYDFAITPLYGDTARFYYSTDELIYSSSQLENQGKESGNVKSKILQKVNHLMETKPIYDIKK